MNHQPPTAQHTGAGWRSMLHRNPVAMGLALLVVLGVAAYSLYRWLAPPLPGQLVKPTDRAFFVDEETGERTIESAKAVPPLAGPSGRLTRVRAAFYSPDKGQTLEAGWYEKYTPEAKRLLETLSPEEIESRYAEIEAGHLVRKAQAGSRWVPIGMEEGSQVRAGIVGPDGKPWAPYAP